MRHYSSHGHGFTCFPLALALVALAVGAIASLQAQGPLNVAPSGRATTEVVLTPAQKPEAGAAAKPMLIRIDYGQPHLRGRQLHTKDLVPYDEVWRLGANEPTKLTTDVDVVIGGTTIARGSYVLRALPGRTAWKLFVEKDAGQSPMAAAPGGKPEGLIASIDLKVTTLDAPLESFTMWLVPSNTPGPAHGELRFAWGTTMLSTTWTTK